MKAAARHPGARLLLGFGALLLVACATAPPPEPEPEPIAPTVEPAPTVVEPVPEPLVVPAEEVPPEPAAVAEVASAVEVPRPEPPVEAPLPAATPPKAPGDFSPAEAAYLRTLVDQCNYVVYYDRASGADPRLGKAAVAQAVRWLHERLGKSPPAFEILDGEAEDREVALRAGGPDGIRPSLWLARRHGALACLEISFAVTAEGKAGRYSAAVQGSIAVYEAGEGGLLASLPFASAPAFSPSSAEAAAAAALAGSVWSAMPRAAAQVPALMEKALDRGLRYGLSLGSLPSIRASTLFARLLAPGVREVDELGYEGGRARYAVYALLPPSELEAACREAARQAGLGELGPASLLGFDLSFGGSS